MGHWLLVNLGFQKKWVELMGDPQVPQVTMAFNIQHMVQELDELGVPEKKKKPPYGLRMFTAFISQENMVSW